MPNPAALLVAVDLIIEVPGGIVLIERDGLPDGWALPGGLVNQNEHLYAAAVRVAGEKTGLDVQLIHQLHAYSDPNRDPRKRVVTIAYVARGTGTIEVGDAKNICVFDPFELTSARAPVRLAFDHGRIINDYLQWRAHGDSPGPMR